MSSVILKELFNLLPQLAIAGLVWNYYKNKRYALGEKYATFAPRFWAPAIDACVVWPVDFLAVILLALKLPTYWTALILIVQNLAWLTYTVLMHAKFGQTIGKKMCGVKVVDFRTEGRISFRQALIREGIPILLSLGLLGYEISIMVAEKRADIVVSDLAKLGSTFWFLLMLPSFWFGAEVVTMLFSAKRRALHDYLAGTVVVRTNIEE